MALYGVARDDDSTDQLNLADVRGFGSRGTARTIRAWVSSNGLTLGGVGVSLAILVFFAVSDTFMPSMITGGWLRFAVAAGCVWIQILIVAKWQWDRRRNRQVESRLMQGQADLRSLVTMLRTETVNLRTQVILMRSEMQALLGMLPEGVVNYADRRAVEVSIDAIQRLAPTGTDEGPRPSCATVTDITSVIRDRRN